MAALVLIGRDRIRLSDNLAELGPRRDQSHRSTSTANCSLGFLADRWISLLEGRNGIYVEAYLLLIFITLKAGSVTEYSPDQEGKYH